jgi:hypothetical protein
MTSLISGSALRLSEAAINIALVKELQFLFNEDFAKHPSTVFGTPDQMVIARPRRVGLLIQPSVHGQVRSPLVGNIDRGDFTKGYAFKRTHGLKLMVFSGNKKATAIAAA